MTTSAFYIAQAFDTGAYGACAYQDTTGCASTTEVIGAPNTGIFMQPTFVIPAIIGGAILIAITIFLLKKMTRRVR